MTGALYYPYWSIDDPIFFGEALLLWDNITFIVPQKEWHFPFGCKDKDIRKQLDEAHEKFGLTVKPNISQKKLCREIVTDVFVNRADQVRKYLHIIGTDPLYISTDKIDYKTVAFLEKEGHIAAHSPNGIHCHGYAAHIVMAILAKVCSGGSMPAFTNDTAQFRINAGTLADFLEISQKKWMKLDSEKPATIILKRIHVMRSKNPRSPKFLRNVLKARKEDEINGLRRRFKETIDCYLLALDEAKTEAQVQSILASFDRDMEGDSVALNKELKKAALDTIISKDGAVAVLLGLGTGTLTNPGVGALFGTLAGLRVYESARKKALSEHWTSWLHKVEHPKFSIF